MNGNGLPRDDTLPAPSPVTLGPEPSARPPHSIVVRLALALREALLRLADAVVPAEVAANEMALGLATTHTLFVLARHGIPDLLDAGPTVAADLAAQVGVDADALHRVLRAAAAFGVVRMDASGRVSHGRISRAMRSGQPSALRENALSTGSRSSAIAWANLEATVRTGKTAFDDAFGKNYWEWLEAHPDERGVFARMMMGLTLADAPVIATLYPFREVRRLCDLGGGSGTLLGEILVRHPHLEGVLADAAGMMPSARDLLEDRGVLSRCELEPCDFFQRVPGGCDAYLLKNILHDWDDERCARILANVRAEIAPDGRLLVCEMLLEHGGNDRVATLLDLTMLVLCSGGRERGAHQYEQLLREQGFTLARVFRHPMICVLEARPARAGTASAQSR